MRSGRGILIHSAWHGSSMSINYLIMCLKSTNGMVNSVEPDQTAPKEQFNLALHCLPRPYCLNPLDNYSRNQGKYNLIWF